MKTRIRTSVLLFSVALSVSSVHTVSAQPAPAVNADMGCSSAQLLGVVGGQVGCLTAPQFANASTDSGGAWAVTWGTSFTSASPIVHAVPVSSPGATQPMTCNVTARSASSASGKCFNGNTTVLNLSIVTTGLTLTPNTASGAGVAVMVSGKEPTQ